MDRQVDVETEGGDEERAKKRRRVSVVTPGEEGQAAEESPLALGDDDAEEGEDEDSNGEGPSRLERDTGSPAEMEAGSTKRYLSGRKTSEGETRRKAMRNSTLKGRQEVDERVQDAVAQKVCCLRRTVQPSLCSLPMSPHPIRLLSSPTPSAALANPTPTKPSLKPTSSLSPSNGKKRTENL